MVRTQALILVLFAALFPRGLRADSDLVLTYLERYHRIPEKDVASRLELAEWCAANRLQDQRASLLTEVLKLQPDHPVAYRELLDADAHRIRAVDRDWARKLESLLGPGFRLHHSSHFTILTDAEDDAATSLAETLEDVYRTFYRQLPAIGLRPMPPPGRLVCLLFEKYDDYRDFLRRFEGINNDWIAGQYSWRTNRASFFNDKDNPIFKDVREKLASLDTQLARLRIELETTAPTEIATRLRIQSQTRQASALRADMTSRLAYAAKTSTLSKTRHEAAHQLLYNSGIQKRGRPYPFWLNEGLATNFEPPASEGKSGPQLSNPFRLKTYQDLAKEGKLLPLAELIAYRPGQADEAVEVAGRYAQAWALVHYLWTQRSEQFKEYMEAIDKSEKPDSAELFKAGFGDPTALESQIRQSSQQN
jgi:hypothetical protein